MAANHAIEGYNAISGFSLLTGAYSSNMGFFFVALKPWHERTRAEEHANGVVAALNRAFAQQIPGGHRRGVRAAGHPGPRHRRRLHDADPGPCRTRRRPTWPSRPTRFMQAARQRPEIGRISTLYRATVPQVYADIDRSKVLKVGRAARRTSTTRSARCSAART